MELFESLLRFLDFALDENLVVHSYMRPPFSHGGVIDRAAVRANAERQVYGYQTQATSFAAESELEKAQAAQAPAAAALGASTSLLSGASGVGMQYTNWLRTAGGSGGTSPLGALGT